MQPRKKLNAGEALRELVPGQSVELLRALHLVTRDGQMNADGLRKLKQVNHLVRLLAPAFMSAESVVEFGAGNAYLAFVLYEVYFAERGKVLCVESNPELAQRVRDRAATLKYHRLSVIEAPIATAMIPVRPDVVVALHACDGATDDALVAAVNSGAKTIALVPCCQAEVANQLKEVRPQLPVATQALVSHPWHRREFGSHLTNVIRALCLEAIGYQVTVTELTGWEHALKNELILARHVGNPNAIARHRLDALIRECHVCPVGLNPLIATLRATGAAA